MTEERNASERLIVEAGWVDVPDDLRDRVVTAAGAAVRESQHAGRLDRLWYSTRWRIGAAVTLLTLALVNAIPAHTNTEVVGSFGTAVYEAGEGAIQVARQVGLPEADCQRLGNLTLRAASRPTRSQELGEKEYDK